MSRARETTLAFFVMYITLLKPKLVQPLTLIPFEITSGRDICQVK